MESKGNDLKKKETARVYKQQQIAPGIYDMWITTTLAERAKPGQFISVYTQDKSTLLPRPISICETDLANGRLRIVYRVAGKGTSEFSRYKTGHRIDVLGTLGNGFPLEKAEGRRVFLVGGGIGIPPMLSVAKELKNAASVDVIVGYRDKELFLADDLAQYASVHIATEDGSVGTKGTVIDAIEAERLKADVIFACGPMPMLRAIKNTVSNMAVRRLSRWRSEWRVVSASALAVSSRRGRSMIIRMSRMPASVQTVQSMMQWT